MANRDKVIKGLECCTKFSDRTCKDCPYQPAIAKIDYLCYNNLMLDAMELLKEPGPRVLTLEEVLSGDECWFEYINGSYGYADVYIQDNKTAIIHRTNMRSGEVLIMNYMKKWRCWNYRPTEEQRKAVKWNE